MIVSDKDPSIAGFAFQNVGNKNKKEEIKQHSLNSKKMIKNSRHSTVRITPDIPVLSLNEATHSIDNISIQKST